MGTYKTPSLQCTVLGLTAILISASGSPMQVTVGQSVLFSCPCTCQDRQPVKYFHWQQNVKILSYQEDKLKIEKGYEDRVTIFTNEDKENCSLSLSNINVGDNGTYRCYFECSALDYKFIDLNVVANYSVCMNPVQNQDTVGSNGKKEYQCKASDGYPRGRIYWEVDGRPQNGSSMEIHKDNSTGLYTLTSNLAIELNKGVELLCVVEHKGQVYHTSSHSMCTNKPEAFIGPAVGVSVGMSVGVVVVIVAGVLLMFLLTRPHRHGISPMFFFKQQSDTEIQDIEIAVSLKADDA
ncbi:T-lymphocyte activation antigen CD80 [Esox lucius]|uniref:T-lymphocyte activation antigen CD80 n=1 Tax=Esox lucius TaxID=8010 RepID=UPI0005776048|nr:T-lymphocyte activation antigen CD80 [Esox lucius]